MQPQRVKEITDWLIEKKCRQTVENLKKRSFKAEYCPTLEDARAWILKIGEKAQTIGFGGSLTVALMNLGKVWGEKTLLNHGLPDLTPEERLDIMRRQLTCDLFLTGTNALTLDGCIVNIDGIGNRVAAMFFGPKKSVIVVGHNKIVEGSIEAAIARIKADSAPPNAFRLKTATPCAATGFCSDCSSPERICRITTVLERQPLLSDITVLVVGETLGL